MTNKTAGAKRINLNPRAFAGIQANVGMSGLDQTGYRSLDLLGHIVHLVHPLHDAMVKHREPRCVVNSASLSAVRVERFEHHHRDVSSPQACRRHHLQQSPSGCFRTSLFGPDTAAKGKADREPAALVEHRLCLFEGNLCALHALPGGCLLQSYQFNHTAASSRIVVPSKGEQRTITLVPVAKFRPQSAAA
ncbi:hypothetical protein MPLB_2300039 [Mesorhizobium sp. ORS 3324]|nr:hypothetical protein MPLB_2300039 [Mesorhizobium sp. ORS 3324]